MLKVFVHLLLWFLLSYTIVWNVALYMKRYDLPFSRWSQWDGYMRFFSKKQTVMSDFFRPHTIN